MKIIYTKFPKGQRLDRPPFKLVAKDENGKAFTYVAPGSRVTDRDHIMAAKGLCDKTGDAMRQFTAAPIDGNKEWIHIEQVNTWVS
jgi:hypothetical protein